MSDSARLPPIRDAGYRNRKSESGFSPIPFANPQHLRPGDQRCSSTCTYYATYAMARAAGVEPDKARIIAMSAQFVDDNVARSHVDFRDSSRIDQEATAHHPIDLSNRDDRDQRSIHVSRQGFCACPGWYFPCLSTCGWRSVSRCLCPLTGKTCGSWSREHELVAAP